MKTVKQMALQLTKQKISFVGSVSEKNAPNIKAMLVAKREGLKTFYFASNNSAMRTDQYKHNNNACIYFKGGPVYKGVMLEGLMEILNDEEHKTMLWQSSMEGVYKNGGVHDPDYCVLRFTAKTGRYYYWFKSESFEISPDEVRQIS
jgi:general stress protein 26